jgi:hypothetical protein
MRLGIASVIAAAAVVAAHAQTNQEPAQVQSARVRYERAVRSATALYEEELKALQRQMTQQGNLDAALYIKAELDRLSGKAPAEAAEPPPDQKEYGSVFQGHRYEVITKAARRNKAITDCHRRGGNLACADSPEELTFLHDLMRGTVKSPYWLDAKVGNPDTQWIGPGGGQNSKPRPQDELPYVCEWSQSDKPASAPSGRTR